MKFWKVNLSKPILIFVAAVIFISSCDDNDVYNPFLGTWVYTTETYTQCDNAADNGTFDYTCNATDCFKVTFQEGGRLLYESLIGGAATTIEGTYSFENTELTICSTGCDDPVSFSIAGNTLNLIREDDAGCTVTTSLEKSN